MQKLFVFLLSLILIVDPVFAGLKINPITGKPDLIGSSSSSNISSFIGTQKYNGSAGGAGLANGDTSQRTSYFKMEAESDFVRVRLGIISTNSTASNGYTAIAAVTETADDSTVANRWYPTVGGTTYNVAQDNSNPYGWRTVTFNGSSSGNIPAASLSGGDHNIPEVLWSDWIELNSVARADGGTLPLVMFRVYKDGSVGGAASEIIDTGSVSAGHSHWVDAVGQSFYRIYAVGRKLSANGVSTLSTVPSETTQYGVGNMIPIMVQFQYKVPARTFLCVGDSRQEGGGYQIYNYDSFSLRTLLPLSTTTHPINLINAGMSSQPSSNYIQHAIKLLDNGVTPTDILIEGFSPNDNNSTNGNQQRQSLIYNLIHKAQKINAKVYIWTDPIATSSNTTSKAWTRDLASKGLVTLLDFDTLGSGILGADNTHFSLTGLASIASYAQQYIKTSPPPSTVQDGVGSSSPTKVAVYDGLSHVKGGLITDDGTYVSMPNLNVTTTNGINWTQTHNINMTNINWQDSYNNTSAVNWYSIPVSVNSLNIFTGTSGQAACFKSDKTIGQCTSVVGVGGGCTCS